MNKGTIFLKKIHHLLDITGRASVLGLVKFILYNLDSTHSIGGTAPKRTSNKSQPKSKRSPDEQAPKRRIYL